MMTDFTDGRIFASQGQIIIMNCAQKTLILFATRIYINPQHILK